MKTLGIITVIILAPIWRGYVFSQLWLWFIVPTFGADPLGLALAIGLGLIVSFLTHQPDGGDPPKRPSSDAMVHAAGYAFCWPAMALLIGWVVKGFLG